MRKVKCKYSTQNKVVIKLVLLEIQSSNSAAMFSAGCFSSERCMNGFPTGGDHGKQATSANVINTKFRHRKNVTKFLLTHSLVLINWCLKVPINPFTPEFLMWTLPSLILDTSTVVCRDVSQKSQQTGKQFRS